MSNIAAGIGRGQMLALDEYVKKRQQNFTLYKEGLKAFESITFLDEPKQHFSNRWLTCVLIESFDKREELRMVLEKET